LQSAQKSLSVGRAIIVDLVIVICLFIRKKRKMMCTNFYLFKNVDSFESLSNIDKLSYFHFSMRFKTQV